MQLQTGLLRHPLQRMFSLEVDCLEGRQPSASLLLRWQRIQFTQIVMSFCITI